MLEHARKSFIKGVLVTSLVLNAIFISAALIFWQTTWLDLPALGVVMGKNCQGDLAGRLGQITGGQGKLIIEKAVIQICRPYDSDY